MTKTKMFLIETKNQRLVVSAITETRARQIASLQLAMGRLPNNTSVSEIKFVSIFNN